MKRGFCILLAVAMVCMTGFIAFGYAALTDTLTLTGTANVKPKPYKGVYITNVEVVSTQNASYANNSYELPTNHITTGDATRSGGSVTYKITVYNNTDVTYWYIGPKLVTSYNQNSLVGANNGITVTLLSYGPRQFVLMLAVSVVVALLSSFLPVNAIARKKPVDAIKDK